ncbi:hypothetical protein VTJ04DRAFT_2896 [Mycothermus thermophilus]|uniref:uncharacterized protein n=1 Tax=Humicola insolens TaxID=85995 RepID=UPI0037429D90
MDAPEPPPWPEWLDSFQDYLSLVSTIGLRLPYKFYSFLANTTSVLQTSYSAFTTATAILQPILTNLLTRLTAVLSGTGSTADATLLLIVLLLSYLTIYILSTMRRLLLFWTRLILRLFVLSFLVVVFAWAWDRGFARTVQDIFLTLAQAAGYVAGVLQTWWDEFERAQQLQRNHRNLQRQWQYNYQLGYHSANLYALKHQQENKEAAQAAAQAAEEAVEKAAGWVASAWARIKDEWNRGNARYGQRPYQQHVPPHPGAQPHRHGGRTGYSFGL